MVNYPISTIHLFDIAALYFHLVECVFWGENYRTLVRPENMFGNKEKIAQSEDNCLGIVYVLVMVRRGTHESGTPTLCGNEMAK